jgi:hypothetical protein
MHLTPDALYEAALQRTEGERLDLVTTLLDTVPPELLSFDDPEFLAELDRRAADDEGSMPWSELKKER